MLEKETYSQLFKWSFQKDTSHILGWYRQRVWARVGGSGFKIVFNEKIPVKDLLNNASLTLGKPTWIAKLKSKAISKR